MKLTRNDIDNFVNEMFENKSKKRKYPKQNSRIRRRNAYWKKLNEAEEAELKQAA